MLNPDELLFFQYHILKVFTAFETVIYIFLSHSSFFSWKKYIVESKYRYANNVHNIDFKVDFNFSFNFNIEISLEIISSLTYSKYHDIQTHATLKKAFWR